jgi:hypothetical protein
VLEALGEHHDDGHADDDGGGLHDAVNPPVAVDPDHG